VQASVTMIFVLFFADTRSKTLFTSNLSTGAKIGDRFNAWLNRFQRTKRCLKCGPTPQH